MKKSPDVSDEDKTCIMKLVEHLLAKGVSKQRAVKYINHLIMTARIAASVAAKSLGQLDKKQMEAVISHINTAYYTAHTIHDYKIIIKKYFQWLRGEMKSTSIPKK